MRDAWRTDERLERASELRQRARDARRDGDRDEAARLQARADRLERAASK